MAEFQSQRCITAKAAADLSAQRYHFVRWSAADTVNMSSHSAAEDYAGILQNKPSAANRHASVSVEGVSKIYAGGSVTANDFVTTNGSGRATAAASGDMVMGRALQAASADGEIITILQGSFLNDDLA